MQLSTKGRYAVMAMVDLATRQSTGHAAELVCLADIASRQQLSQSYLEQLFGKLRRADLVCSARGPGGGYRLARPPSRIAIADIVAAVDEPIRATRCEIGSGGCMLASAPAAAGSPAKDPRGLPGDGLTEMRTRHASGPRLQPAAEQSLVERPLAESDTGGQMCQTHDLWFELGRQITLFLSGITLADVVHGRVIGRAVPLSRPEMLPE